MTDAIAKVEITPTRPTIVFVDPEDQTFVSITRNETLVSLSTAGPRERSESFAALEDVDAGSKVDKSLVYYDGNSDTFKADSLITALTLSDGGNF